MEARRRARMLAPQGVFERSDIEGLVNEALLTFMDRGRVAAPVGQAA